VGSGERPSRPQLTGVSPVNRGSRAAGPLSLTVKEQR